MSLGPQRAHIQRRYSVQLSIFKRAVSSGTPSNREDREPSASIRKSKSPPLSREVLQVPPVMIDNFVGIFPTTVNFVMATVDFLEIFQY